MQTTARQYDEGLISHRGRVRQLNEDSYGSFRSLPPASLTDERIERLGRLYVLADGMGGHDSGDIASALAVQQICAEYYATGGENVMAALRGAITRANAAIQAAAQARPSATGRTMGTTIVCAVLRGATLTLAHVGDSRAYLLRDDDLRQLTEDHDWATDQARQHGWSRADAEQHAQKRGKRGMLTRALGAQPAVEPDIATHEWRVGDTLLLCSDGLHGLVPDAQIKRILAGLAAPSAARELIEAANAAGGHDNITALVVHGQPTPIAAAAPWARRVPQLAVASIAALLLAFGLTLPVADGQPLLSANTVRSIAGLPTLAPTVGLLP
ncbi:MAG: serine/threonine-protein phosphatase, partial [Roseiflexaceae bacterium]|nr:serine/threonine-protein phosphatase [Roseiflexaceae bacterium]